MVKKLVCIACLANFYSIAYNVVLRLEAKRCPLSDTYVA